MSKLSPDRTAGTDSAWLAWITVPCAVVVLAVAGRVVPYATAGPVQDPWLRDWIWPSLTEIARSLRTGAFPLWNTDQHGGIPFLADPRQPALAPLTWLFVRFPFPEAVLIHGMVCLMGAGVFTVLWMRTMGISALSSVFSAAVYLLGPFASAASARPGLETVCCWLPLACWAAVSFFHRPKAAPMIVGAIAMSLMLLSGEPVVAVLAVAASWIPGILARWQVHASGSRAESEAHLPVRMILWLGCVLVLAAPQGLPVVKQFVAEGFPADLIWTGMPACCVLPARSDAVVSHILTPGTGIRWGDPGFTRHLAYIHPLVILVSVAALAGMWKKTLGLPLTGLAFLLVPAVAAGLYFPRSPLGVALTLPGQLGMAGLCGLGVDRLFGPEPDANRRLLLILSLFLSGGVYVITGGAAGWNLGIFSLCCMLALAWGSPYTGGMIRLALLLMTTVTLHQELVVPMNLPGRLQGLALTGLSVVGNVLEKQRFPGRVAVVPPLPDEAVGSRNAGMLLQIPFVGGWNHPTSRDEILYQLLPDCGSAGGGWEEDRLNRFRRVYAVNALVMELDAAGHPPAGFSRAASLRNGELLICDRPISRWSLYGQWVAVPNWNSAVDALRGINLEEVCVLQLDAEDARTLADRMTLEGGTEGRPEGVVFPQEDRADRLSLWVQSDRPALLVVADAWDTNWICRVNGRLTPIMRANGIGRAVMVPAGAATITFVYAPLPWKLGMAAALVLLAMCCGYGAIMLAGHRASSL